MRETTPGGTARITVGEVTFHAEGAEEIVWHFKPIGARYTFMTIFLRMCVVVHVPVRVDPWG